MKALTDQGYNTPTPVQQQAIPEILKGRDLQACAQTGTGKTAAFAIPVIQLLEAGSSRHIRALVLTPTRELALQIQDSFSTYGKYTRLRQTLVYGGVSQHQQTRALQRGTDILVATPGRLLDLMQQGFINFEHLQILVLDEADQMLDMGFINDIRKIINKLPVRRQTLLFSATMPKPIQNLASQLLNNPARVEISPSGTTAGGIRQSIYHTTRERKPQMLLHLLATQGVKNALVFTRTKHGADRVTRYLINQKVNAAAIHGNKSQAARQKTLKDFKLGSVNVLVATDVAARGIDIDQLSHVFNFDLPNVPETYIHRIGRTGRAGLEGTAIAFCDQDQKSELKLIEKLLAKKIPVVTNHPFS